MKKGYSSPEFDVIKLSFDEMLSELTDSTGEIIKDLGDNTGVDE